MLSSNTSAVSGDTVYVEDVFSTWLYKGNGGAQTITNNIDLSTKGGLVWIKNRGSAVDNALVDTTRGAGQYLISNSTAANTSTASEFTGFTTSGFGLDSLVSSVFNGNNQNYASWTFRKQPKFFDVVTYTGNGTAGRTVAHSLGSVPGCVIVKQTSSAGNNWKVYHRSLGGTKFLNLSATTAAGTDITYWNNTDPTSTVFTVGDDSSVNANGSSYVAYIFAHDAGGFGLTGTDNVISCGSFSSNDAANGAVVNLGYEPQWVLIKSTGISDSWNLYDTMRGMPVGSDGADLYPNTSGAETVTRTVSPTATGFIANNGWGTGYNFIYIAIRRGPMKVPTDGTKVFAPIVATSTSGDQQTTNFPVDMQMIAVRAGLATNTAVQSRLTGVNTTATLNSQPYLVTSSTAAEATATNRTRYWNNTGYQLPNYYDGAASAYWNFQRAPSFFDEVCYTGTGANQNLSHNLGVVPELMIAKSRSFSAAYTDWIVYTSKNGSNKIGFLDLDAAFQATPTNVWPSDPTSSVFTVGASPTVNSSGNTYVAYLFATCPGVSKVFNYTGNGSSQTINCGFTAGARWIMIKRTDSTGDWYVWDTARGIVAGNDPHLSLNTTAAEVTTDDTIDTDSTGFIVNQLSATNVNVTSATYIGIAIA